MAPTLESSATDLLARLCDPAAARPRPAAMLVLAHPDDETVGAASLLPELTLATFVYLTDGAPRDLHDATAAGCASREEYASMRRGELLSALESVGVAAHQVEMVGTVDQEASLQLAALARWLEILMREHRPAIVLTHPYEGGHPDHDSAAFAVQAARNRIASTGGEAPLIGEFTSYHAAGDGWEFGLFLPGAAEVLTRPLRPAERALKRRLIGCYASQRGLLRRVPLEAERFRVAPAYDFTSPPHAGPLLYEQFPWGITGAQWRTNARGAMKRLPPSPPSPATVRLAEPLT